MMLLKALGALGVVAGGTLAGWLARQRVIRRPRDLEDLRAALHMMETEVGYALTPLPSAMEGVGRRVGGTAGDLLATAGRILGRNPAAGGSAAWRHAVHLVRGSLSLSNTDLLIVDQLFAYLGDTGREDQLKHLQLAQSRLLRQEEEARRQQAAYGRLYFYLGFAGGAALALLLW